MLNVFAMVQIKCDNWEKMFENKGIANSPHNNALVRTVKSAHKEGSNILKERIVIQLYKRLNIQIFNYVDFAVKLIYNINHIYINKLQGKSIMLLLLMLFLAHPLVFAQQNTSLNHDNQNREQFTKSQVESLRKRFRQAGYRNSLYRLENNYKYWYCPISTNISANQISEKLNIPTDTLLMLAKSAIKFLFNTEIEEYEKIYTTFFNNPTLTISELNNQKTFDFNMANPSAAMLYFAYDPNIKPIEERICDKLAFSDNLRTYHGEFTMKGFGLGSANIKTLVGTANYQYKDASDGSRIFEGKFSFDQGDKDYKAKAEGYFMADKQVGKWIWNYPILGDPYDRDIDFHCEILFNENGVPDGEFDIYIGKDHNSNGKYKRSYYSGTFENGKLVSINFKDNNLIWCRGQYGLNGKPKGVWHMGEKGSHAIEITYDEHGNVIKSGYRDNSTGDWIVATSTYPQKLYSEVVEMIRYGYCFRSTSF